MKCILSTFLIWLSFLSAAHATTPIKVLFVGDSLTDGYGVAKEKAFPKLVEERINSKKIKQVQTLNAGISGSLSSGGKDQLKWHLKSKPQVVVITLGGNDGRQGTDPKVIKRNLKDLIQIAKEQNIKVLLSGMRIFTNFGEDYSRRFAQIYSELAREEKVPLIPFLLEGVAGRAEFNIEDGFHPNEKGHEVIATTVIRYLEPLL